MTINHTSSFSMNKRSLIENLAYPEAFIVHHVPKTLYIKDPFGYCILNEGDRKIECLTYTYLV
ncbi:hypothetical protein SAMN05421827_101317 [Pedobacter terrae]|uniref:Uncharacterized protein n=1 Tax=Pedobacter terrae TaxID=405671 RepID=A0A1G7NDW5_9SPHI|nr:hypothetical protein SAMN05421827_101317 [Pedobacter terrae]